MSIPHNRGDLHAILVDCVRASGLREAYVEMICTRGLPKPGSRDPRTCTNRFFAFAVPFVWIANPQKQKKGLHLIVSCRQRIPPESVDPVVKNYHFTKVDGRAIGSGTPGPVTQELQDGYWTLHEDPHYTFKIDYD